MIAIPRRRRTRRRWAPLDRALAQDVLSTHHGKQRKGRLTALLGELEFRVAFEYGGGGSVTLSVPCPCLARFAVSRRTGLDGLLRGLPRLACDPPLLDPQRFVLEARDLRVLEPPLRRPELRAALESLFEAGARRVELGPQGLEARFSRDALGEQLDKAALLELIGQLDVLREAFAELAERQPGRSAPGDLPLRLVQALPFVAWLLAALVAGFLSRQAPLVDGQPPLASSLLGGLAWLLLGLGLGVLLLSRRTAPQRALAGPLLILLLGAGPAGWATVWWLDVQLDDAAPRVVRAPILELRQSTRGERVLGYRAAVSPADLGLDAGDAAALAPDGAPAPRRQRLWLPLPASDGQAAQAPGANLELALQPGALGAAWVREWRVAR